MLGDFMGNGYYTHVIPTIGKKATRPYKSLEDKEYLSTDLNDADKEYSCGFLLAENAVLFDFDGTDKCDLVKNIIDKEQIDCRMSKSQGEHGGIHVTILNDGKIEKSYTNVTLAIGICADIKCGSKNAYEMIKYKNKNYPVFKDTLGIMPFYFRPIKNGIDFTSIASGERTNKLGGYLFKLVESGFTADEAFECVRLINKYVLKEPLSDSEINSTTLNDSTYSKLLELEKNSCKSKHELNLDTFLLYLNEIGLSIKYNVLTKRVEFSNVPNAFMCGNLNNVIPILIRDDLKKRGYKNVNRDVICDYIFVVADKYRYNPIQKYFTECNWDKKSRFNILFDEILNISDEFSKLLIKKWFIQCVAMLHNTIEKPIQLEGVLVLCGREGVGKSRFFQKLCENPVWFRTISSALNLQRKDDILNATGGWIVEIAEIDATLKNKNADIKGFLTNIVDNVRLPYAREETSIVRTTSFCGTTNKSEFLNDESGFRRFWCVDVDKINIDLLTDEKRFNLRQFWLECYEIWLNDENYFRLTDNEKNKLQDKNSEKTELLPAQDELMTAFDFEAAIEKWHYVKASVLRTIPAYNVCNYSPSVIGKALNAITKLNVNVKRIKSNGDVKYFVPPIKSGTDQYRNKG